MYADKTGLVISLAPPRAYAHTRVRAPFSLLPHKRTQIPLRPSPAAALTLLVGRRLQRVDRQVFQHSGAQEDMVRPCRSTAFSLPFRCLFLTGHCLSTAISLPFN